MNYHKLQRVLEAHWVTRQPLLIWGPPGVGKTAAVRAFARARGIYCEDVAAPLRDAADFLGLPDLTGDYSRYKPFDWLAPFTRGESILFLDEISNCPPQTQAALMRLVLERRSGDLRLSPDCWVVAAANPPEYSATGFELSAPLANRFSHLTYDVDASEWTADFPVYWGAPPECESSQYRTARAAIAAFIRRRPDLLIAPPKTSEARQYAWPSPRSWDRAARLLATLPSLQSDDAVTLMASAVGDSAALEAAAFLANLDLPEPADMLRAGRSWKRLERPDLDWAAVSAMVASVLSAPSQAAWTAAWDVLLAYHGQEGEDIALVGARALKRLAEESLRSGKLDYRLPADAVRVFAVLLGKIGA